MDSKTIVMTLSILLAAGFSFIGDGTETPTHYCDDRFFVAECDSLSSTGKTCYTLPLNQGGKRCSSIWQQISQETIDSAPDSTQLPIPIVLYDTTNMQEISNFKDFTKDSDKIHCYLKGDLRKRVKCDEI